MVNAYHKEKQHQRFSKKCFIFRHGGSAVIFTFGDFAPL